MITLSFFATFIGQAVYHMAAKIEFSHMASASVQTEQYMCNSTASTSMQTGTI